MLQELILTIILFGFLLTSLWESVITPEKISISTVRKVINIFSTKQMILFLSFVVTLLVLLVVIGYTNPLSIYLLLSFSILITFHALWLSWKLKTKIPIFLSALVIFLRILYPSPLTHDVFVFLVVVWLGVIITSFNFFTRKVFIVCSLFWFVYDIFYIWITSGYHVISTMSKTINFPLSLSVGNSSIGLADLFYAVLLISAIKSIKSKVVGILLFVGSYHVLLYYAYTIQFISIFPLLVLWVPCGFVALGFTTNKQK